ncbi:hypothetical protein QJQ45_029053 [Haematococcus lacustris]|nr:hypothetical protein QJQ45_029053 [Haematococcus lacustris]
MKMQHTQRHPGRELSPVTLRLQRLLPQYTVMDAVVLESRSLEQSDVDRVTCRLLPKVAADAVSPVQGAVEADGEQQEFLVKSYNMQALMHCIHKPVDKWHISAASFFNEARFLSDPCQAQLQAFTRRGVPAVRAVSSNLDIGAGCSVQATSWQRAEIEFVLEYLSPQTHYQVCQLTFEEAAAALKLLARFHAFFWTSTRSKNAQPFQHGKQEEQQGEQLQRASGHDEQEPSSSVRQGPPAGSVTEHTLEPDADGPQPIAWPSGLFARGAWWRKALRPSVDFTTIPASFAALCRAFPDDFATLDTPDAHQAMAQLSRRRVRVGWRVLLDFSFGRIDVLTTAVASAPARTVVHGDFKTSNIFFRRCLDQDTEDGAALAAAAIDFQWTGYAPSGLADVVYCLYAGVQFEVLQQHEQQLLMLYLEQLQAGLEERGLVDTYNRVSLSTDLDQELCVFAATALAQLFRDLTPSECASNAGRCATQAALDSATSPQALAAKPSLDGWRPGCCRWHRQVKHQHLLQAQLLPPSHQVLLLRRYGWLTCEMDPRCTALLCSRAVAAAARVLPALQALGGCEAGSGAAAGLPAVA